MAKLVAADVERKSRRFMERILRWDVGRGDRIAAGTVALK
jgi:hypothetical protein